MYYIMESYVRLASLSLPLKRLPNNRQNIIPHHAILRRIEHKILSLIHQHALIHPQRPNMRLSNITNMHGNARHGRGTHLPQQRPEDERVTTRSDGSGGGGEGVGAGDESGEDVDDLEMWVVGGEEGFGGVVG